MLTGSVMETSQDFSQDNCGQKTYSSKYVHTEAENGHAANILLNAVISGYLFSKLFLHLNKQIVFS